MNPHHVFQGDWTWTGERFEPDVQIAVDDEGRIMDVGRLGLKPTKPLSQRALLPGFVNAHSHAFQRGLRGRGEEFLEGAGSFWTWREAMYRLVQDLDGHAFYRLCLQTFREMRAAGITTVGEFHYLHHSSDATDYAFDALTLRAAAAIGIRIVLLNVFYKTGGIGQP
ncbi:MAG: amidohydrolase family protein, partial [Gemmatimonadetes bacterium]|nr:amidohydrolase family protein [Gemmatimonadota bacterium]